MPLAPLDNQVVFKKLFRDPIILEAFLYDLLGVRLGLTAEQIELEKQFHPPIRRVDFIMDIFVDNPSHRMLIEIQRERYSYNHDRFLHYHQAAIVELASGYRGYSLEREVHTVVWLTQKVQEERFRRSLMTTSLTTVTELGERLTLYPHKLYFLNPYYLTAQTPAGLQDWMKLITESITNPKTPQVNQARAEIQRAINLIEQSELTPFERAQMKDEEEYQDTLAAREKKSRLEGLAEGKRLQTLALAQSLLDVLDDLTISQKTGLPIEEIRKLRHA